MPSVAAPGLTEVAAAWWDVERAPVVSWEDGRSFWLTDAEDASLRLHLISFDHTRPDAEVVAHALAEGLAGCDFPPTGSGAEPRMVTATLRARGLL